jgi:hypothetical protein
MIGVAISHFRILEKPPTTSRQVGDGGMSQNGPRTLFVPLPEIPLRSGNPKSGMSGCRFEDPPSFALFASAGFWADWRRCAS